MENYPDNSHVFDPDLEPLTDPDLPEDDPYFLLHKAINTKSGEDGQLHDMLTQQLYLTINLTMGQIDVDIYNTAYDQLTEAISRHKARGPEG